MSLRRAAACLIALAVLAVPAAPAHAGEERTGHLLFEVDRNGSKIGTHRLDFARSDGGALEVEIAIDLRVGLGPLTFYRYEHRTSTRWEDGRLVHLDAETDDDGDAYYVRARRQDDGRLRIDSTAGAREADGALLPSTYWMRATVEKDRLLNTQTGEIGRIKVAPLGPATVPGPDGEIEAEGFEVTGDLQARTWYDAQGRWVKLAFEVEGDEIAYRLVERDGFVPGSVRAGDS